MDAPTGDPILGDESVVEFLAHATGTPADQVEEELMVGARRRAFVVDELTEAGLTGAELLGAVIRLTGLDDAQARRLLQEHAP
ncbi:MAG: hypothetical protein ACXVRJ_02865 [Gaiellaceae bacterium]